MGQRCPSLPSAGSPATFRTDCPLEILFIHRRRRCARAHMRRWELLLNRTSESDLTSLHDRHGGTCIHHSDTIPLRLPYQACAVAQASSAAAWRNHAQHLALRRYQATHRLPGDGCLAGASGCGLLGGACSLRCGNTAKSIHCQKVFDQKVDVNNCGFFVSDRSERHC